VIAAPLNPSVVRLILFDAVGTLIYPEPSVAAIYHSLGQHFGSRLSRNQIKERFQHIRPQRGPLETDHERERSRWKQIVASVLDDITDIEPLFTNLWEHFARGSSWRVYPDVPEAWPRLLATGIPLGVASNFDLRLHGVLAELELPQLSHIFSSAEIGYSKPDPRFFCRVEEITNLQPQEILLVGDDEVADVQGALSAGWQCQFLSRDLIPTQAIVCPTISSLSGVYNLFG
jgi:putative hydrolase of the HAD superfamily